MVDKLSARLDKAVVKMEKLAGKTSDADRQMKELDRSGLSLEKTIGKLAAAFTMKELVSNITKVRGEFQQLEVAFETMLGSAEKARTLMSQLTQTAATTPFGLEDVAQGAKQLLAYGFEAEKVNETLIRLGDIAAGLSIPLGDLVYLYGTTMAQGRLYTQDLNQFTGRGLPMIGELAKQFGVAEVRVKELVEAGKVGFPEVQKVIESLTDEGGKFGGLMAAQSQTITGQISNIEDAISMMLNDLGQQSEGIINTTLSGVSYMVENYERFGRILLGLVATYGVYKTAIMTVTAAKGWATAAEALHYNWLLLVEKAQKMLNATMLANPYVLVATLMAGVVVAMVSMKTEAERLKEAEEAYEAQKQKVIEAEEEHRRKIADLCSIAGDEAVSTDTRREALNRLEQKYPDIFSKYDTEYEKLKNIKKIKEEIALLDGRKSIANPVNELKRVEERIRALEAKKATERWEDANGSGTRMRKTGGLSQDEEAELKNLLGKKGTLSTQIRKNEVNAYFEHLTGVSNETIAQQIRQRETLLARMRLHEKTYGHIAQGNASLTGTYSRDELQYQLNKLRSEQNRRKEPVDSSSDWAASARRKYTEALKAYNDFIKDTSNNLTQEEFEQKAKGLKDAVDTAKKEYDKVKPGTDKEATGAQKAREKAAREAEKQKQAKEKLGQELAELQLKNDAAEIAAMDEGLQKKLRQIDADYEARKNEIDKQEAAFKKLNIAAGGGSALTAGQQAAIEKARWQNEQSRQKAVAEAYATELRAMNEYLGQYGSFEQKRLSIAQNYAERIKKAETEGEKLTLQREQKKALSQLSVENVSLGIDWKSLLSGVGALSQELMRPMLEQLEAYAKTAEYGGADMQEREKVVELIGELRKYIGTDEGGTQWKRLETALTKFSEAVAAYKDASEKEQEAVAAREAARGQLALGELTQEDFDKVSAEASALGEKTAAAREEMQALGSTLGETAERVKNYVSPLTAALSKLGAWEGVSGFDTLKSTSGQADALKGSLDSTLPTLADGAAKRIGANLSTAIGSTLGTVGRGLTSALSSGLGSIVGIVAQIPKLIMDIVDAVKNIVTGVLDAVTELISLRWIDDLVNGILDAVGNLINAIFDLPENIYKVLESIIVKGVGGLVNTVLGRVGNVLTFGLLSSDGPASWFNNSNAAEVQATIDRLTKRNEQLQTAIEDLTDEISSSKGTKSVSAYRDAYKLQEETIANYKAMAQAQAGYHGSHHSWNYYWGGFTQEQKNRLSGQIGRSWNGDIWDLSPEEMKMLRTNVDMWERIQSSGKGGYGSRLTDKLDDYIDQAGKLEDLTHQLYEGLTGMSFDSMYDSFIDTLMDMDASSKDFADNISEYFMRAMLSNKIGEIYSDRLEAWWKKFGAAMEDNNLTEAERKALQDEYMAYVEEAMKLRDDLAAATGYDSLSSDTSQSAKSGGFSAMTQDQGTKLEGMFTSGLQHWSSMDAAMENVSEKMNSAENHLARIEENTGRSAGHLGEIKEEMKKIIRDGLKVK